MIRRTGTLLCFLFILFSFTAVSQDSLYARTVIRELCDEKYHGRGYVNNGDRKAARYIAKEFRKHGVTPITGNSFFQEFTFSVNSFPGCMEVKINDKKLAAGIDYIVHPATGPVTGCFPVLRVNEEISRYSSGELKGKWLLADTAISNYKAKRQELTEYVKTNPGAAGILWAEAKKLTWSVSREVHQTPQLTVLSSALPDDITFISVNICSRFLPQHKAVNVIGMIAGSTCKDSFIVVSAHYDHLGRMGNSAWFPGANDNASGVAMLLNLAQYYSKKENQLPYSLAFIAFAGEEAGLEGSKYYTEHPFFPLERIRFLLNLDLLGTGDEGMMVVNATEYPLSFQALDSINIRHGYLPKIGQRGKAANSDHYWFTEAGVPAFFCYTMGGVSHYHDVFDREATLPLTRFKESFLLFDAFLRTR